MTNFYQSLKTMLDKTDNLSYRFLYPETFLFQSYILFVIANVVKQSNLYRLPHSLSQ